MRILVDSNVLIAYAEKTHVHHERVRNKLRELIISNDELLYTSQGLREFWAAVTRSPNRTRNPGMGLSIDEAKAHLQKVKELFVPLFVNDEEALKEWESLVETYSTKDIKVHDANIVASMRVGGISHLMTINVDDFKKYGIDIIEP